MNLKIALTALTIAFLTACGGSGSSSSSGSATTTTPVTTPTVLPQLSLYIPSDNSTFPDYVGIAVDTSTGAKAGTVYLSSGEQLGGLYSPIASISASKVVTKSYSTVYNNCDGIYTNPANGDLYTSIGQDVYKVPTTGAILSTDTPLVSLSEVAAYGAISAQGNLFVLGQDCVYKVNLATGTSSTIATSADIRQPWGIAVDAQENVYVTDSGFDANSVANGRETIVKISPTNGITTIAGTLNTSGSLDGPALSATFSGPTGLALDSTGNTLYIADRGNNVIRVLDLVGQTVSTIKSTTTGNNLTINDTTVQNSLMSMAMNADGNLLVMGSTATGPIDNDSGGKMMETSVYLVKLK